MPFCLCSVYCNAPLPQEQRKKHTQNNSALLFGLNVNGNLNSKPYNVRRPFPFFPVCPFATILQHHSSRKDGRKQNKYTSTRKKNDYKNYTLALYQMGDIRVIVCVSVPHTRTGRIPYNSLHKRMMGRGEITKEKHHGNTDQKENGCYRTLSILPPVPDLSTEQKRRRTPNGSKPGRCLVRLKSKRATAIFFILHIPFSSFRGEMYDKKKSRSVGERKK